MIKVCWGRNFSLFHLSFYYFHPMPLRPCSFLLSLYYHTEWVSGGILFLSSHHACTPLQLSVLYHIRYFANYLMSLSLSLRVLPSSLGSIFVSVALILFSCSFFFIGHYYVLNNRAGIAIALQFWDSTFRGMRLSKITPFTFCQLFYAADRRELTSCSTSTRFAKNQP